MRTGELPQPISSQAHALRALDESWPEIVSECRRVLGSELHYQAIVYHCLRAQVPLEQIGMNVKMWIADPVTEHFRDLGQRKSPGFQGGFEPIPDVVIFSDAIAGDWRRRNHDATLRTLLAAVEVKASERKGSRLQPGEIETDIAKLAAHRVEAIAAGGGFAPAMMVIDTAPDRRERMTEPGLQRARSTARAADVAFYYVSADRAEPDSTVLEGGPATTDELS